MRDLAQKQKAAFLLMEIKNIFKDFLLEPINIYDSDANKIRKRLYQQQKNKNFKDSGIITTARKYKAAVKIISEMDLTEAENNGTAATLVVKEKVFPSFSVNDLREKGASPGVVFWLFMAQRFFPNKPRTIKAHKRFGNSEKKDRLYYLLIAIQFFKFLENSDLSSFSNFKHDFSEQFQEWASYFNDYTEEKREAYQYLRNFDYFSEFYDCLRFVNSSSIDDMAFEMDSKNDWDLLDKKLFNREQENTPITKQSIIPLINIDAEKEKGSSPGVVYLKLVAYATLPDKPYYSSKMVQQNERNRNGYVYAANLLKEIFETSLVDNVKNYVADVKLKVSRAASENFIKHLDVFYYVAFFTYYSYKKANKDLAIKHFEKAKSIELKGDWESVYQMVSTEKTTKIGVNEGLLLSHIVRKNGLKIPNIEVSSIQKYFGYKNVGFGNYVKDHEAKDKVKHFLGAMTDLCEVLNINPLDINKPLSIGFGLAGRGGKALATYYPHEVLINLTKKKGDGSLAHEWGHFLDNFITEFSGFATKEAYPFVAKIMNFIFRKPSNSTRIIRYEADPTVKFGLKGDTIEEVMDYLKNRYPAYFSLDRQPKNTKHLFGYIAKHFNREYLDVPIKISKGSDFFHNSKKYGAYWATPEELFARAFETFVYEKLVSKNMENNYLVNHKKFLLVPDVYPQGEERAELVKLFDEMILELKENFEIQDFKPHISERENINEKVD